MLRKAQREMQARRRRGKAICRAERGGKVSNNYCPFRRGKPRHLPRGGRLGTRDVEDAVPYDGGSRDVEDAVPYRWRGW